MPPSTDGRRGVPEDVASGDRDVRADGAAQPGQRRAVELDRLDRWAEPGQLPGQRAGAGRPLDDRQAPAGDQTDDGPGDEAVGEQVLAELVRPGTVACGHAGLLGVAGAGQHEAPPGGNR
jgi:hypothetical protein